MNRYLHRRSNLSRRTALSLLGGAGLSICLPHLGHASTTLRGVFGYTEIRRTGSARFPKWKGALDRTLKERGRLTETCRKTTVSKCEMQDWQAMLNGLRAAPRGEQIERVNLELNRRAYVLDPINWGVADYWASPAQFFQRNGDCEDYSIAKYMSLRDLGVGPSDMRLVVLNDMNLKIPHAVLAVRHGNDELILDNQVNRVVSHRVIRHYRPIFSINEEAWWLHRS